MDATAGVRSTERSGLRGGGVVYEMKLYVHERGCCSFYCATAPTASENAKHFCEMSALRVFICMVVVIFP